MLKDKDKMPGEALSLRDCSFIHENGWKIKEPDIEDNDLHLKETDPYLLSSLTAYDSYHNIIELNRKNCLITAIETDAGVLVFDNSAYGMLAQQDKRNMNINISYLSQIAEKGYSDKVKKYEAGG